MRVVLQCNSLLESWSTLAKFCLNTAGMSATRGAIVQLVVILLLATVSETVVAHQRFCALCHSRSVRPVECPA